MEKPTKRPICAPCHKYILQNLKTHTDVAEFEKSFLTESVKDGFSKEEAYVFLETTLMYLPADTPVTRKDFMLSEYTDYDSLLEFLNGNPCLKQYAACRSFYRRFDSATSMCAFCYKYDKYLNLYKEKEACLLHYLMADISHFDKLNEKISPSVFCSVFDLADGMKLTKPVVISAYSLVYDALRTNIYEYFNCNMGSHPSVALLHHFVELVTKGRRIPASISSKKNWSGVFFQIVMDTILDAPEITDTEAEQIVELLCKRPVKQKSPARTQSKAGTRTKKVDVPAPEPVDVFDLKDIESGSTKTETNTQRSDNKDGLSDNEPSAIDSDKNDSKTSDNGHVDNRNQPQPDNNASVCLPAVVQLSTQPFVVIPGDPYSRYHTKDSVDGMVEEIIPPTEKSVTDNTENPGSADRQGDTKSPYRVIEDKRRDAPSEDIYPEDLAPFVVVTRADLKNTMELTIHNLSHFETNMTKDTYVFVEVIALRDETSQEDTQKDTDGTYTYLFLFYLRHANCFYFVSPENTDVFKFCKPYLEHKSYKKVCFAPYLLYGVGMLYSVTIKNVHSLMTTHYLLEKSSHNHLYGSILKLYEPNLHTLPSSDEDAETDCPYLYGMPMYMGARHNQMRLLKQKDLLEQYGDQLSFDELLGRSYLRERFFESKEHLFDLKRPGGYQFHDYTNLLPLGAGTVVTYAIENAKGTGIIKSILLTLAKKGRFRTMPVCLLGMTATSFSMFLSADVTDYMNMQIHMTAVEQLKEYQKTQKKQTNMVIRHNQKVYTV